MDVLGKVVNVGLMRPEQRMFERDVHRPIAVFNVENNGVAAGLSPSFYNLDSMVARCHEAGQVNGTDFEVLLYGNGLLDDRRIENPGNSEFLSGFQERAMEIGISAMDRFREFRGSEIRSLRQIMTGYRDYCIAAASLIV